MTLNITGQDVEATSEQILKVVHNEDYRGVFFILSVDQKAQQFIQAMGPNDDFHVEYRDGASTDNHYVCKKKLTCAELESLCLKYLDGDLNAVKAFEWCTLAEFNS